MKKIFIIFFLFINVAHGAVPESINEFNLKNSSIARDELLSGGVSPNGIPPIQSPTFTKDQNILFQLRPNARAIIVERDGIKKAYPLPILNWHEIVNDEGYSVTYCPLAGTGIVFENENLTFGVSGFLFQSNLVLFDEETLSLFPQIWGMGISSTLKEKKLKILPSKIVSLKQYLKNYPETKILMPPKDSGRNYKLYPYGSYEFNEQVWYPIRTTDKSVKAKKRTLFITDGNDSLLIPISSLLDDSKIQLSGLDVPVIFDLKAQSFDCTNLTAKYTCISGFWFALKTFYPNTKVFNHNL